MQICPPAICEQDYRQWQSNNESQRLVSKAPSLSPSPPKGGGLTLSAVALVAMNSACARPQRPPVQMVRTATAARMIAPTDHFDLVGRAGLTRGPLKLDVGGTSSTS